MTALIGTGPFCVWLAGKIQRIRSILAQGQDVTRFAAAESFASAGAMSSAEILTACPPMISGSAGEFGISPNSAGPCCSRMLAETKDPTMEGGPYSRVFPLNLRGRSDLKFEAHGIKCTERVLVTMQARHCQPLRGQSRSCPLRILLQLTAIAGLVLTERHRPKGES